jgi:hypothetical protein
MEMKFASNAKGNAGLTTGIIGTALGALNSTGMLGGLLGGNNCCTSEDHLVNRYEAAQQARIAELETEVKLRDSSIYTDSRILEVYKYFDSELKGVRDTLCAQAVHNQRTEDSFVLARQDIAAVENRLNEKIKMEAERRCCGDNSIITYANATFYPKLVADVTAGTTTTAQTLYNPLPNCGCNCNC